MGDGAASATWDLRGGGLRWPSGAHTRADHHQHRPPGTLQQSDTHIAQADRPLPAACEQVARKRPFHGLTVGRPKEECHGDRVGGVEPQDASQRNLLPLPIT